MGVASADQDGVLVGTLEKLVSSSRPTLLSLFSSCFYCGPWIRYFHKIVNRRGFDYFTV